MEKSRPAKRQLRRDTGHHVSSMGVHVKGVVGIVLPEAQHGSQGRNCRCDHRPKGLEILCTGSRQEAAQLPKIRSRANPFKVGARAVMAAKVRGSGVR